MAKRAILVVIFDDRSSLELVQLRVKRTSGELEQVFDSMVKKGRTTVAEQAQVSPFAEITDEDIDALFSD